jgi:hypothetical protein
MGSGCGMRLGSELGSRLVDGVILHERPGYVTRADHAPGMVFRSALEHGLDRPVYRMKAGRRRLTREQLREAYRDTDVPLIIALMSYGNVLGAKRVGSTEPFSREEKILQRALSRATVRP